MQVLADPTQDDTWATIRQAYNHKRQITKSNGLLLDRNQCLRFLRFLVLQFVIVQDTPLSKGVNTVLTPLLIHHTAQGRPCRWRK
jgi:hypothetical protein